MHFIPPPSQLKRLFYAVLLLTFAAGCSPLSQLKQATADERGDFHAHLAQEYLSFAQSEQELERHETSRYFAKKGLKAARRQSAPPEKLADWELEGDIRLELQQARARLLAVRTDFLQRVVGQNVARAQLFFDCWVMQAAGNADSDLTLPCRQEFIDEMQNIDQVINTLGPAPDITLPAHFTIEFPFGSAELTHDADYAVQQVLAVTTLYPDARISLTGHTDRAGSEAFNLELSLSRAEAVESALLGAGIDPGRITLLAVGEDDPEIPTLDGISRSRNRRVEISIYPADMEPPGTDPASSNAVTAPAE